MKKKLGTIRFEVEWCSEIPKFPDSDDRDIDRAKYEFDYFDKFEDAIKFAIDMLKAEKDAFGSIRVEKQELGIDPDILEHEDREVRRWECLKYLHVDDINHQYSEKDLESPTW